MASPRQLRIEGEMTIYRAQELHQLLLAELVQEGPLEIDLSDVSEIDCAGLQLIAASRTSFAQRGRELLFVRPSEAVREVFDLLGLAGPARLSDSLTG